MNVDGSTTEAYVARVLGEVHKLALRYALDHVDPDVAEDLAQGLVCACLTKMREGTWREPRSLPAWVLWIGKLRLQDAKRWEKRCAKHDAIHARMLDAHTRAWMSAELTTEIRILEEAVWSIVLALPDMCCMVWFMIRVEHQNYDEAAEELGVTRRAVAASLVRAQHLIRAELIARGIDLPPEFASPARGGVGELSDEFPTSAS